jgi:hypothetical protein
MFLGMPPPNLLDDLVGAGEQRRRHVEAERAQLYFVGKRMTNPSRIGVRTT